jgi:hypothetical protein
MIIMAPLSAMIIKMIKAVSRRPTERSIFLSCIGCSLIFFQPFSKMR